MKKHVSMVYRQAAKDIDSSHLFLSKHIYARDNFKSKYQDRVYCSLKLFSDQSLSEIKVTIEEVNEPRLMKDAIAKYMTTVGPPIFVDNGFDYDLMNKVLEVYVKILKRKSFEFIFGKNVVDLENKVEERSSEI